ncbi:MAG: CoB--CoM heterodisulfide reductase iron-sulfur subunit A family protein, partial [Desulfobacterales bacterium]|nr:CoB--CoM heterodisulfide reductase iron-sulfur subunit A family protein [Desulfobacterales bacterium]
LIQPLAEPVIDIIPKALVIGGGLAGMTAALSLAEQGFECYLIEKTSVLGGNLRNIHYTLEGEDPKLYLNELIDKVTNHDLINVITESEVESVNGFVGNFSTLISTGVNNDTNSKKLEHGIIILANGAMAYEPDEYMYGRSDHVVLQHVLEERIASGQYIPDKEDSVVMIQCVGSRDDKHPYCSSICCSKAIKNALKIKEINPATNIYILYRDMRPYGFHEDFYKDARDRGVVFIRYDIKHKPDVTEIDGGVCVTVRDPIINKDVVIDAKILALSTAIIPRGDKKLEKALSVTKSAEGFFLESHVQLKPVDSYVDGIYICGMSQFPKPVDESIFQA